jgi:putative ABC transport system substrate-binding protein
MRRREFLGSALGLIAPPFAVVAQPTAKIWRIGFISVTYSKGREGAFFQRLRELGYAEGENLVTERRYSEGRAERFPEFAAELVRLNVDIIVVSTTPAALAVKHATRTIPVVFTMAIDPVGAGVVASLARPGAISRGSQPRLASWWPNSCNSSGKRSHTSPGSLSSGTRPIRQTRDLGGRCRTLAVR